MKAYLCIKACTLSGTKFEKGEVVPKELLVTNRIPRLISMGLIQPGVLMEPGSAPDKTNATTQGAVTEEKPNKKSDKSPASNQTPTKDEVAEKAENKPVKRQPSKNKKAVK